MVKVREFIKELQTYNVGGRSELSSDWECFDWNESEFPPTNKVFDVVQTFYRYERYPDITAKKLKLRLAEYVSLPPDFIEVYNNISPDYVDYGNQNNLHNTKNNHNNNINYEDDDGDEDSNYIE